MPILPYRSNWGGKVIGNSVLGNALGNHNIYIWVFLYSLGKRYFLARLVKI